MLPLDSIQTLRKNSVILDNTTLFTCHPMRTRQTRSGWFDKWWAKHLIDWGMSNLVESLILYESVYVDGQSRYQAPIVEQIADQFDGVVRGIDVGPNRDSIFSDLSTLLNENRGLAWLLYLISTEVKKSGLEEKLHVSYIYDFLQEERSARDPSRYVPDDCRVEPLVFRTHFYLLLSALAERPYVPYPLRNPLMYALSDNIRLTAVGERESYDYYHRIVREILHSFDSYVRNSVSKALETSVLQLPPLPMPTFWEVIKEASGYDRREILRQVTRLRERAKPYRQYVAILSEAYLTGDLQLLQREVAKLQHLQEQWSEDLGLPRFVWKKVMLPISVSFPELPHVQLGSLEIPLKFPTPNPYRKSHFVFLHDWVERRF
ncbi:MAG: hypothetical protein ACE5Q6_13220 [Dehalococcoidia bacterium]